MSWRDITLGELNDAFNTEYHSFYNEWDDKRRKKWALSKFDYVDNLCTRMYDGVHPVPYLFQHMLGRLEALRARLDSMRKL